MIFMTVQRRPENYKILLTCNGFVTTTNTCCAIYAFHGET